MKTLTGIALAGLLAYFLGAWWLEVMQSLGRSLSG